MHWEGNTVETTFLLIFSLGNTAQKRLSLDLEDNLFTMWIIAAYLLILLTQIFFTFIHIYFKKDKFAETG